VAWAGKTPLLVSNIFKVTIGAVIIGSLIYLFKEGSDKASQWASQVSVKITGYGKPTFYNGQLALPVQLQIFNPSPLDIPITDFKINLFVSQQGQYNPLGYTLPTGNITLRPGANNVTLYPSVDITKLNPLANGTSLQTLIALVQNTNPLLDVKADALINIKGFSITQTFTQKIYFDDLVNAVKTQNFASLGLVPNGKRKVTPVPAHLLALVPKPTGVNEVIKPANADPLKDTVPLIKKLVKRQLWQGKKLAAALKKGSVYETVKSDWDFIFNHIQYKLDADGKEQVRSLRRLIWEGKGDCDCYTNALSNLLTNQGIDHELRVTSYNNSPDPSHIYIVVPTSGGKRITLDCVVHKFNYEVPFTAKKDFAVWS
jgi:hypothetical protein